MGDDWGTYGDQQAYMTGMRASYGDQAQLYSQAAFAGAQTVVGGAGGGIHRMLTDMNQVGQHIMPLSYTPPAYVVPGYGGGYSQKLGVMPDIRAITNFGNNPQGINYAQFSYNASTDLGERIGMAGVGLTAAGASLGMGLSTLSMGMIPGLGIGMAAGAVIDKGLEGLQQRRAISQYLTNSSYSYINSGSADYDTRRGGFNHEARMKVGEFIRDMSLHDGRMDFDGYQQVLKQGTELGMFAGSTGVEDFKKKFKSLVTNVKAVSTALGQSLEEAMKTMKELKGIGIVDGAARTAADSANIYGAASGHTSAEMVGLGLQGAEMFRGTGVKMSLGYASNLMNAASIRAARDAGSLSQEAISQAGGEEALAQRMTAGSVQFMQSTAGRGFAAAYSSGGTFNASAFAAEIYGGNATSLRDTYGQAAANVRNPGDMVRFTINQAKTYSEMGEMFGGRGLQMAEYANMQKEASLLLSALGPNSGLSSEDAFRFDGMTRHGKSQAEMDAIVATIKDASKAFEAAAKATNAKMVQEKESLILAGGTYRGVFATMGREISQALDPVSQWAEKSIVTPTIKWVNEAVDSYHGATRTDNSGVVGVGKGAGGSSMTYSEGERLASAYTQSQVANGNAALDTSLFGKDRYIVGDLNKYVLNEKSDTALTRRLKRSARGDIKFYVGLGMEADDGIDSEELASFAKDASNFMMGDAEVTRLTKGKDGELSAARQSLSRLNGKITSIDDIVGSVFPGKKWDQLNREQVAIVRATAAKSERGKVVLAEADKGFSAAINAQGTINVASEAHAVKEAAATQADLASYLGIDAKTLGETIDSLDTSDPDKIGAALNNANLDASGRVKELLGTEEGKRRMTLFAQQRSTLAGYQVMRGKRYYESEKALVDKLDVSDAAKTSALDKLNRAYNSGDVSDLKAVFNETTTKDTLLALGETGQQMYNEMQGYSKQTQEQYTATILKQGGSTDVHGVNANGSDVPASGGAVNPVEAANVQMRINMATLSALEALKSKW